MKRSKIVAIAVVFLIGVGMLLDYFRERPRLTIMIDGVPAANLSVIDGQTGLPRKLDATGTTAFDNDHWKQNFIFVEQTSGNYRMIPFPSRGHKTVDLRGRHIKTKSVVYYLGLVRRENTSSAYELTDEEFAALKAGERTLDDIKQTIRNHADD
ncbi:hypothetical protein [Roseimaritima sediminicola]|uniref:hypothetical protein n=1 Tax=Roseimaritima sediminicola TaxID=2662066 RepID=UPI00129824D1|nr:hypothetical protein [Roseimaritima sediminicola]